MRTNIKEQIGLTIITILGAVICVAPLAWMILSSLKPPEEVMAFPPEWITPNTGTLVNYMRATEVVNIWRVYLNSAIVTGGIIGASALLSAITAYALAKLEFPGREIFFMVILLMIMIPFHVILIPLYLIIRRMGFADSYLGVIFPFLVSPFNIFLFRQYFVTIPSDLIDAATIDGCNEFTTFIWIVLPLARPVLALVVIFTGMFAWNTLLWPLIVLRSEEKFTLPLALLKFFTQFGTEWGAVMAFSTLAVLPLLILFFVFQKQFVRGIMVGGVRG